MNSIKKRKLGNTGLEVTELGLGTWSLSGDYGPVDRSHAVRLLRHAFDLGVNFFDTADIYGQGKCEKYIGEALSDVRKDIIIATKVGWDFYHGGIRHNFDPDYIKFAVEQSLKRLKTDYIDVYQLHNPPDYVLQDDGVIDTLNSLREQGIIKFWGVSVATHQDSRLAMERGASTLQLVYNIVDRDHEIFTLKVAPMMGVGIIVRTPLAFGFLTGKYRSTTTFPETDFRRSLEPARKRLYIMAAERVKELFGTDDPAELARIALRFVLSNPSVSTVIQGAKTFEQLEANIRAAAEGPLGKEELRLIDKLIED